MCHLGPKRHLWLSTRGTLDVGVGGHRRWYFRLQLGKRQAVLEHRRGGQSVSHFRRAGTRPIVRLMGLGKYIVSGRRQD